MKPIVMSMVLCPTPGCNSVYFIQDGKSIVCTCGTVLFGKGTQMVKRPVEK